MTKFYLVTGNAGKLAQYKRLLPSDIEFEPIDLDLPEIQSLDSEVLITDKAKRAYQIVQKPVVIEDVAAGLTALNGLPGPFIKFFEQRLGADALAQLATTQPAQATVSCTIGFYDGSSLLIARGTVKGTVVPARGSNGFGFDSCFVPDGQTKTFAEMTNGEKDAISHRSLAVLDLLARLKDL
ncbi:MAG: putative nucleoside triphosphatase [Candidatus Saccharibacteria bacterium]|nr:putative nucleoside triphosphatase [Candidatus Saccharibacteria bacterium]